MALIECPECGGKVSTAATVCPHCGYPISQNSTTTAQLEICDDTWTVELPFAGMAEYRNSLANELLQKGYFTNTDKLNLINNTTFPFVLKSGISEEDASAIRRIALKNHLPVKVQSIKGKTLQEPESVNNASSARCPFCGSTSIQAIKKGFGLRNAIIGTALLGPVGALGGAIGSNEIQRVCLSCGKTF